MPRIEDDLLVGMIGMKRGEDPSHRVIEENGAHANLQAEFELVTLYGQWAEKGLELADGLALVVEKGPAATGPTRIDDRTVRNNRAGFGLSFGLHHPAVAVGVAECDLCGGRLTWREVADMGLPGDGSGEHR